MNRTHTYLHTKKRGKLKKKKKKKKKKTKKTKKKKKKEKKKKKKKKKKTDHDHPDIRFGLVENMRMSLSFDDLASSLGREDSAKLIGQMNEINESSIN